MASHHTLRVLLTGLVLACIASAATAQTWEYKSYKKTRTGSYNKDEFIAGTLSLEEKDGKALLRVTAGTVDACLRGEIPVIVTRTAATTAIELEQPIAGCEPIRYLIRNDGSGGQRQVKRDDKWVKDGFDHGLTPKP